MTFLQDPGLIRRVNSYLIVPPHFIYLLYCLRSSLQSETGFLHVSGFFFLFIVPAFMVSSAKILIGDSKGFRRIEEQRDVDSTIQGYHNNKTKSARHGGLLH